MSSILVPILAVIIIGFTCGLLLAVASVVMEVKVWECRNCGHIVVGTKAPDVCPVCNHPQSYFEVHAENY